MRCASPTRAWALCALGVLSGACAAPAGDSAEPSTDAAQLSGSFTTRYRGRDVSGGDDDHDLVGVLALDLADDGPADERRGWTASLLGRVSYDLDGLPEDDDTFASLTDTRGDELDQRLYHAWVDLADSFELDVLRLGRQRAVETPEFAWFDGVAVETQPNGARALRFGGYGGVPVHPHESSPAGDALGGVFVEVRPWDDARVRVDYMRLEDERGGRSYDDDLLGVDVWQTLGDELSLHAELSRLDGLPRDVGLDATWVPRDDWLLRASAYRLSTPQEDRALEADPFFDTLRTYEPFDEGRLYLSHVVSEHLTVDVGGDVRRVRDPGDVGDFNRDYERVYVTATLEGALPGALDLALTYDDWSSDASEIEGFDAELGRTFGGDVEAWLGTDVSLFRYDFFLDEEREDVRTWYLRLAKRPSEGARVELRYEYQEDDLDRYRDLMVVVAWRF